MSFLQSLGGGLRDFGSYTNLAPIRKLGNTIARSGSSQATISTSNDNPYGTPSIYGSAPQFKNESPQPQGPTEPFGPSAPSEEEQILQALIAAQSAGGSGGGGAGAAGAAGIKTLPDGRIFNLNDPTQRLAYSNALKQILGSQRDSLMKQAEESFKLGDTQAVQQYQQYLTELDQNIADVEAEAKNYVQDYQKTLTGFNDEKKSGDVSRQSYFSNISPNAFQSSQATSQGAANNKYLEGLTDLTNQAQSTVGLDYLNDPTKGINAFAPDSQFGRNVGSINTQRTGLQNSFNSYRTNAQNQLQQSQSQIGQNYLDSLNSENAQLGAVDIQQGKNPFQYGLQSVQPYQAPKADLGQYSQYTNFQSLANPTAQGSQYQKPVQTQNAFTQNSLDTYLNRTNTKMADGQKNDWFTKYLQGKVTA